VNLSGTLITIGTEVKQPVTSGGTGRIELYQVLSSDKRRAGTTIPFEIGHIFGIQMKQSGSAEILDTSRFTITTRPKDQTTTTNQETAGSIPAEETRLIGIIVDIDTGLPVPSIQVTIQSLAKTFQEEIILNNSDGKFDFGLIDDYPGDCKFIAIPVGTSQGSSNGQDSSGYQSERIDLTSSEILEEIKNGGVKIKISPFYG
jgi:hypothetical protein